MPMKDHELEMETNKSARNIFGSNNKIMTDYHTGGSNIDDDLGGHLLGDSDPATDEVDRTGYTSNLGASQTSKNG